MKGIRVFCRACSHECFCAIPLSDFKTSHKYTCHNCGAFIGEFMEEEEK